MGCNCKQTSICSKCQAGNLCGCPPDYSVRPLPVDCNSCCPPGYYLSGEYCCPNGTLTCRLADTVPTIPCQPCEDSIPAECVIFPQTTCAKNPPGYNLLQIIDLICPSNPNQIMQMFETISTNATLYAGFCNLIAGCGPIPGSSTPILGPISWVIP